MKKSFLLPAVLLMVSFLPAAPALGAPSIAFLNPSGYSGSPPTISDVTDQDGFVHLVAWSKETPMSALVEFELQPTGQNAATFTGVRITDDTWEAFASIPDSYSDSSSYTLIARLYSGTPGDADEVAHAEMTVEVNQSQVPPPIAETVEMSYPDNGGKLGFYRPVGKRPSAVLDYAASVDTGQVRAFYTLTRPGSDPAWKVCGKSIPDDAGFGKVRCPLQAGDSRNDVTAVAVVSNKTSPPNAPNPALDDTGDAHRINPYLQKPTSLQVANEPQVAATICSFFNATVTDQFDRPIAAANIDVHAKGPTDRLRFMSQPAQTSPFQPPNTDHGSKEDAKRCSDNSNFRRQGVHNDSDGPDAKHIESIKGTSNKGEFLFGLRSPANGSTQLVIWVDVNNDDDRDNGEILRKPEFDWTG